MQPEAVRRAAYYIWLLPQPSPKKGETLAKGLLSVQDGLHNGPWALAVTHREPLWDVLWAAALWKALLPEGHLLVPEDLQDALFATLQHAGLSNTIRHTLPSDPLETESLGRALATVHRIRALAVVGSTPAPLLEGLSPAVHLETHARSKQLPTLLLFAVPALLHLRQRRSWSPLPYFPPAVAFGDADQRRRKLRWAEQWWDGLQAILT